MVSDATQLTPETLDGFEIVDESKPKRVVAIRLGLVCSLYMRDPHDSAVRLGLARCADQYQALFGEHLRAYCEPFGDLAPLPSGGVDLQALVREQDDVQSKDFGPFFCGDMDPKVATHHSLNIFATSMEPSPIRDRPAYFAATLPASFLANPVGEVTFEQLVLDWCTVLSPFTGYAGLGIIQSVLDQQKSRTVHLAYPLAMRFPGLEVDRPSGVASRLYNQGQGMRLKGVNWLTALDHGCLEGLGGRNAVLGDLGASFQVMDYPGGVLIKAGVVPQLGDRNLSQLPASYQTLARKLAPLRYSYPQGHSLLKFPRPGEMTGAEVSNAWLARFD